MTSLGNSLNELKRATRATHASLDEVIRAVRATTRSLDEVVRSGRATNNSMKYVTKAAQTTVNRLNDTAADLRTLELDRTICDRVGAFAEAILAEVAQVQLDAVEHDSALTRLEAELKRALLRANRDEIELSDSCTESSRCIRSSDPKDRIRIFAHRPSRATSPNATWRGSS